MSFLNDVVLELVLLAFFLELVDSTLGGGYGTIMTPLLIIFGFEPLIIVPAILVSEILTGFASGYFHNQAGNVDIVNNKIARVSLRVLVLSGVLGIAVAMIFAISIPSFYVKVYIAFLVIAMGSLVLLRRNHMGGYQLKKMASIGLLCAFNKGISGGGYGPVSVSGQLLSGVDGKAAIAVTSISEAAVCVMGVIGYLFIGSIDVLTILLPVCAGALLATPFAALTVSKISMNRLREVIGVAVIAIGLFTLTKVMFF
ncbi:MAG: sulfite exporter TauE/SafE family protein [Candidatus Thorarchaeota archaeon]